MSQFYARAEDENVCLKSMLGRSPVTITGLTVDGRVCSFMGMVYAVEHGHRRYPEYPLRVTILEPIITARGDEGRSRPALF
jgi:hypothetical protein